MFKNLIKGMTALFTGWKHYNLWNLSMDGETDWTQGWHYRAYPGADKCHEGKN